MFSALISLGMLGATIRISTPLILAAIGAALSLKANLFNTAIEGFMLIGAFLAVLLSTKLENPYVALLITVLMTGLLGVLYGFVTITLGSDHIIAGLGFNLFATGITTWILQSVLNSPGGFMDPSIKNLPVVNIELINNIPILNVIFNDQDLITYSAWIVFAIAYLFVHQSKFGLRLRATGEYQLAASTLGIKTIFWKYFAALWTGIMAGLAGASISLSHLQMFSQGMTAGRGFIAFAAATFANGNILGTTVMALLFGFFGSVAIRLEGYGLPTQFVQMIPYLMTLLALIFTRRNTKK